MRDGIETLLVSALVSSEYDSLHRATPHVSHALFTPRWGLWHANAGTWKWAEEGPGEAMDIRLSKACLPVWLHFQKHYPQEAKEMLKAREEAGVKPTEGIPMTGWT